jgi:hypothetical protein
MGDNRTAWIILSKKSEKCAIHRFTIPEQMKAGKKNPAEP